MPYNPQVPDLVPQLLMQAGEGFSRGIDSVFEGIAARKKEEKTRAREFKSMQEYLDAAGIATKDQTTPMDLERLKGLAQGHMAKEEFNRIQRQNDLLIEQLNAVRQQNTERERVNRANRAWNDSMTQFFKIPEGVRRPMTAELLMNEAAQAGMTPEEQVNLARAASEVFGGHIPGTVRDVEGLDNWMFGVTGRSGGGSFLQKPNENNSGVTVGATTDIIGPDGNPTGQQLVWNGRGWRMLPRTRIEPENEGLTVAEDIALGKRIEELRNEIELFRGSDPKRARLAQDEMLRHQKRRETASRRKQGQAPPPNPVWDDIQQKYQNGEIDHDEALRQLRAAGYPY